MKPIVFAPHRRVTHWGFAAVDRRRWSISAYQRKKVKSLPGTEKSDKRWNKVCFSNGRAGQDKERSETKLEHLLVQLDTVTMPSRELRYQEKHTKKRVSQSQSLNQLRNHHKTFSLFWHYVCKKTIFHVQKKSQFGGDRIESTLTNNVIPALVGQSTVWEEGQDLFLLHLYKRGFNIRKPTDRSENPLWSKNFLGHPHVKTNQRKFKTKKNYNLNWAEKNHERKFGSSEEVTPHWNQGHHCKIHGWFVPWYRNQTTSSIFWRRKLKQHFDYKRWKNWLRYQAERSMWTMFPSIISWLENF